MKWWERRKGQETLPAVPELKLLSLAKTIPNSLPVSIRLVKKEMESLVMYSEGAPSIFNCL